MQKVIAIVGPTASGKSSLGLYLARTLGGEIISADSRQIYKGMGIISRAPSKKELRAVPHHFVAVADPTRAYTAGMFAAAAKKTIVEIANRDSVTLVVGGAGFYADALLSGFSLPEVPPDNTLRARLQKKSAETLYTMLQRLDAARAAQVDPKNKVRLIRSIEIAKALGKVPKRIHSRSYEVLWLGRNPDPRTHAKAITKGVEERLTRGMVREAKKLQTTLSRKRFLSLGFEYVLLDRYMRKEISKRELIEAIANGERIYSKRQMRWFKRNPAIHWVKGNADALRLAKEFISG